MDRIIDSIMAIETLFPIEAFIAVLKKDYKNREAPVITRNAAKGYNPYCILISTLISLRTRDAVTAAASERLFERAKTPAEMIALGQETTAELIYPASFYPTKSERIIAISRILVKKYKSQVPETLDELLTLPGVGRKTANLVLIEGFQKNAVCVDSHVHRISNRIGFLETTTPEKTEMALRANLPEKYWIIYPEMLVSFGQGVCRPVSPFCSRCKVSRFCERCGVTVSR